MRRLLDAGGQGVKAQARQGPRVVQDVTLSLRVQRMDRKQLELPLLMCLRAILVPSPHGYGASSYKKRSN
jgi:hypothetical protein